MPFQSQNFIWTEKEDIYIYIYIPKSVLEHALTNATFLNDVTCCNSCNGIFNFIINCSAPPHP